jgi:hypothetical protein
MSDRGRLSEDTGRSGGAPVIARKLREKRSVRVSRCGPSHFVARRRTDTALPRARLRDDRRATQPRARVTYKVPPTGRVLRSPRGPKRPFSDGLEF